ncbi:DNA-binding LytR/AlgR family response regulator [Sphingomonas kyeonggiensis]|uniref:DNA-binding LytR/AlgR family response regulator n=1 Tax=Sphingomonas kyeonggiensis TaxID=1268553 RepID=A0A7W7K466_9SPHN|nr:LytTR family DNA-binding domain-containing protein [Sphingomonas kyeonggiensis]MBB4840731.1 DNA-binding LytR/AlgR family response regulator [Sphingomonas kyeonggiensis]
MRVLLVDDEPLALDRLKVGFGAIEDVEVAGTASDGIEAVEQIRALRPDLVILDIQMPGRSGMEIARALRPGEHRPEIIFVTAFERFAADAFEVEAADYLLKPVAFDRLRLGVERARRRRALRDAEGRVAELEAMRTEVRPAPVEEIPYDQGIWVPGRQGAVLVPVTTIDWIEAARDYVLLNTSLKSHILRARMNDIEKRLDPAVMLRIHRSHIVRIGAVVGVERPGKGALRVVLSDGAVLQVGPNYQAGVEATLKL